jgi:hypothetical protein
MVQQPLIMIQINNIMTTIFEELEKKICQSRGSYSFTDDRQGKKTYTIFSEELKQSLRDVVHEGIQNREWQINHTVGENIIRYRKKQNNVFGSYWKNLAENSPDEFVMLAENRSSAEKEEFEETKQRMGETRERMAETKQRMAKTRERMRNRHSNNREVQYSRSGEGSNITYSGDESVFREALRILDRERAEGNSNQSTNQNNQQTQIRQSDNSKFFSTFWNSQGKKS